MLRRRLVREPATSLLAVAGVALGTGSVVTVQVLTQGAVAAFDATVDLLGGDADALVLGHGGRMDESLYPVVLGTEGVASASPLLERSVLLRRPGEQDAPRHVPLYGVDLLSPTESALHPSSAGQLPSGLPPAAVSAELARTLALGLGDTLEVARGPGWVPVVVHRLLDASARASAAGPMLVVDMADAQNVLGETGWISRINVRFRSDSPGATVRSRLASRLDGSALVSSPAGQRTEARRLLSAFRVNLAALALVSVFVGLFLVYGTTRASLSRRRHEAGLLRSMGATRSQVLGATLAEAGALGAAGAALGVPLGYVAALANLESVSGTVTDLYLLSAVRTLDVPPRVWFLALAGGVAGTVAGAAGPAVEVCLAPASELLSERRARVRWRSVSKALWRVSWVVLGLLLTWFAAGGHRWRHAGFVLAAGIMVWTATAAPAFVAGACRLAGRSRGFGWRFALAGLPVRLHTSGVAVAGVAVAFAMLVGTTVMVGSFRDTFRSWLDTTLQADVYLSAATWTGATDQGGVDGALLGRLRGLPGVAAVGRLRGFHGYADDLPVALRGIDFRPDSATGLPHRDRFLFMEGDPEAVAAEAAAGAVAISEPLARRAGVRQGDSISVRTSSGAVRAAVAGVYYQYGSDRGAVSMDWATMDAWFGPGEPHALAVYLDPGDARAAAVEAVRRSAAPYPVVVRSHDALRTDALRIFDQTFAVTLLLQAMALAVAAAGVALSLLVMAREEALDIDTCRALGATRGQLFRFHLGKGAGLAGIGGLLGLAGGAGLAAVLIYVTNRAYFGWTVQFDVPALSLFQQCASLALAAVTASLWPAFRAAGGGGVAARRSAAVAAATVLILAGCSPRPEFEADSSGGPGASTAPAEAGWLAADPAYSWSFPADHGPHFGYKTEWWYFTGVLSAEVPGVAEGAGAAEPAPNPRELGYQFTVFKIGLRPPGPEPESAGVSEPAGAQPTGARASSRWAASALFLGHMAVSDPAQGEHVFSEVLYRAGRLAPADPLLAGFGATPNRDVPEAPIAWSRGPPGTSTPWRLDLRGEGFAFAAADDAAGIALSLDLRPTRPLVFQGPNGYSRKSSQPGRASMYYSRPRLATTGTVWLGTARYSVAGASWMDHEFSSEPLAPEQVGWDWLGLRLLDGTDVMLFRLRRSDGRADYRAATVATSSAPPRHLAPHEWSMTPGPTWTSPATGAAYPVEWTLALPGRIARVVVRAAFPSQENVSSHVAKLHYWEGLVRAFGPDGRQVGEGYLEMTGYGEGSRPAL